MQTGSLADPQFTSVTGACLPGDKITIKELDSGVDSVADIYWQKFSKATLPETVNASICEPFVTEIGYIRPYISICSLNSYQPFSRLLTPIPSTNILPWRMSF